jgi:hypothetical protein
MTPIRPALGGVTLDGTSYDTIRAGVLRVQGDLRALLEGHTELDLVTLQLSVDTLERIQTLLDDPMFQGPMNLP